MAAAVDLVQIVDDFYVVDEADAFARFASLTDLDGATVLEIGGALAPALVSEARPSAWWAVDPRNEEHADGVRRTIAASGSETGLADSSVDIAFSCNALQHVHPVGETLAELHRVLRPGGRAYFAFGPVWSAPDGSHVEGLEHGGEVFHFWESTLLPAWAHLVLDAAGLHALAREIHGGALGRAIASWVTTTTWLNRRPLHQLLGVVDESPLAIESIVAGTAFGYDFEPPALPSRFAWLQDPEVCARRAWTFAGIPERHLPLRDVELILVRP